MIAVTDCIWVNVGLAVESHALGSPHNSARCSKYTPHVISSTGTENGSLYIHTSSPHFPIPANLMISSFRLVLAPVPKWIHPTSVVPSCV
jgi:hypothetical protein